MSFLHRYLAEEDVWQELIDLRELVRIEPLKSETLAIAKIIAIRMRSNIIDLISRLNEMGYRFGWYDANNPIPYYDGPFNEPSPKCQKVLNRVEELVGPLPVLCRAWYETIGSVDFSGFHPDWNVEYLDPLVVFPLSLNDFNSQYTEWVMEEDAGTFRLDIAPDYYHKANVSGGLPYSLELPNDSIDGILLEEPHNLLFLHYLRLCLKWGGFPGIAKQPSGISTAHLETLTQGFVFI